MSEVGEWGNVMECDDNGQLIYDSNALDVLPSTTLTNRSSSSSSVNQTWLDEDDAMQQQSILSECVVEVECERLL